MFTLDRKPGTTLVFLLSPAKSSGKRAIMLRREAAEFDLAVRLRTQGAPVGEVFSFLSGLYFRGKLAYARHFAPSSDSIRVITPDRGLISPDTLVSLEDLERMAEVPVDCGEQRYMNPFCRDARSLCDQLQAECPVVLLGSIATDKYAAPLLEIFGRRLLFPGDFVGRGDMSRGGLMLRAIQASVELDYIPVLDAIRKGSRPPKLPPMPKP